MIMVIPKMPCCQQGSTVQCGDPYGESLLAIMHDVRTLLILSMSGQVMHYISIHRLVLLWQETSGGGAWSSA